METRKCKQCGEEFQFYKSRKDRKFCSKSCYNNWQKDNTPETGNIVICDNCGEEVKRSPSHVQDHNFCDNECRAEWMKDYYTGSNNPSWEGGQYKKVECDYCGEEFKRKKAWIEQNENDFCCKECADEYAKTITGEEHFNWRGGKKKYGAEFRQAKEKYFSDKKQFCAVCGTLKNIHIHHILPYRYTEDNSRENLIPLCASCHRRIEAITWDMLEEFEDGKLDVAQMLLKNILRTRQDMTREVIREIIG